MILIAIPPATACHNEIMTNISKLASQSTQIFMKKGFTHAAVSFAMSTLET